MAENTTSNRVSYFNVLSVDHGRAGGIFSSIILARLVEKFPKLIRDADLLAGTAYGAAQVMSLAYDLQPSAFQESSFRAELEKRFGDTRLGELSKRVLAPVLEKSEDNWHLKMFHTFQVTDSNAEESVVDVILRSAEKSDYSEALGENPSLVALSHALDPSTGNKELADVSLLSIGDTAHGGAEFSHYRCKALLLSGYHRVSPSPRLLIFPETRKLEAELQRLAEEYDLTDTLTWLKTHWQ